MPFGLRSGRKLKIAVLSPHLDDGVLSLGASIADATRAGHEVAVVTIFAGRAESTDAPGRWDSRAGFTTAGEAASTRMDEDRRACSLVGAKAVWLPFSDGDYGEERDEEETWVRLAEATHGYDVLLAPGRPLIHPDHAWLSSLVNRRQLAGETYFYAELPYDLWTWPRRDEGVAGRDWTAPHLPPTARVQKWRATAAYRSQLRWLGRGVRYRRALTLTRIGNERVTRHAP